MRSIAPSRYDAGTAFLTVDVHQVNNRDPLVYRTTDYGATWRLIVNGIPKSMLSYAKVIYEDPVRRGMLYLGTENAIYVTFDAGDTWQPLQNDLPHAPVSGIVVQEHFNDLVISTYGRGFYILDDITPLRAMTPQVLDADAHLFALRAAYRFRGITAPSTPYDDPTVGENPQYGAAINYYVKQAVPAGGTVTISNAAATSGAHLPGARRRRAQPRLLGPALDADEGRCGSAPTRCTATSCRSARTTRGRRPAATRRSPCWRRRAPTR